MRVLIDLIDLIFAILNLAILARVVVSWVNPNPYHPAMQFLYQVTEPILAPIRRYLPQTGMIDFSPLVAIILLQLVHRLVLALVTF
jgi:YggT family protein